MRTGTPNFIGRRLQESRQVRQLTMTDLAEKIGVSPQAISSFEKGAKTPHPSTFLALCSALRMHEQFFRMPLRVEEDTSPIFFRSLSAATKRARVGARVKLNWLREIYAYLSRFVRFPPLDLPDVAVPRDPLELSSQQIEDIATACRRHWGLGDGPISDLALLLQNKGFILARSKLGNAKLDAISLLAADGSGCFVMLGAEKGSAVRSRFDVAHELGHAVLHRGLSQRSIQSPVAHREIERQAHRFAAALLFPRQSFLSEVMLPSLDLFAALKERWKMAIRAMIVRARNLGMLSQQEHRNMQIAYNRRGWSRVEPLDDKIPIEQPRLLKRSVEMLTERSVFSTEQMRNALGFGDEFLAELLGLPTDYFEEDTTLIEFPQLKIEPPEKSSPSRVVAFPER